MGYVGYLLFCLLQNAKLIWSLEIPNVWVIDKWTNNTLYFDSCYLRHEKFHRSIVECFVQ